MSIETDDTQPGIRHPAPLVPLEHAARVKLFGHFAFTREPLPSNPEHVQIAEPWQAANLVRVHLPQLDKSGVHAMVRVHKLIAAQLLALWAAWEAAGLLPLALTFDGAWASRFKRQTGTAGERAAKCALLGEQSLSNHCWGTAFDINAQWNPLGHIPTTLGAHGSTRALVPLAEQHGFAWGGNFHTRPDGMHFEAVRVL